MYVFTGCHGNRLCVSVNNSSLFTSRKRATHINKLINMSLTRKVRCREIRGPTPHSVAVRAKPPDYLTMERRLQSERQLLSERENFAELAKQQRAYDIKNLWIKSSDRRYIRSNTERQVKAGIVQSQLSLEERRERLRVLLATEEQEYLKETEKRMETVVQERQAKMVEKAKVLRNIRETKRQQMVSEKMEQLFVNQCEELRTVLTKRKEEEARLDWAAQVQSKKEQRQLQQMKDRQFAEMWEATHQMEVQKESERAQTQQQKAAEHLNHLRAQMDAKEQQRQQAKQLKEEETRLLCEHKEMLKLQAEREKQQKLIAQQTVRKQLNQSYRMKMKRLAKEQQEELALDLSIIQQVLTQETDEKQEAAQKKNELREQQQRYRQYLADEMEKQKRVEKETDLLIEEKLRETWTKREEQSQKEREARNRLMKDVLDGRSLQIEHKLKLNKQKQAQLASDREELNRMTEEIKVIDQEEKRWQKEQIKAYQADLRAQIQHHQHLKQYENALEEREFHNGLAVQNEYERMKERVLSRPISHTTALHPFRHSDGAKSAPSQHHRQ